MSVVATVTDPDGRRIQLTAERWAHIVARHPALEDCREEVLRAVAAPSTRTHGRQPGEEWFTLDTEHLSGRLRVVVAFKEDRAFIVTAYPA